MNKDYEGRLERREQEVQVWKEEASELKADVTNLNRRVQRFDSPFRGADMTT